MRTVFTTMLLLLLPLVVSAQLTLEQCQEAAYKNYPQLAQYGLIELTTKYSVDNAKKSYIPQVSMSAQATYQNNVVAFSDQLAEMFSTMGIDMVGINKDQYKINLEVNQAIWDGGVSKSQQQMAIAQGAVAKRSLDVEMYGLKERINGIYFGILLLQQQRQQNEDFIALLNSNCDKMQSYIANGVAMGSDMDAIKAELIGATQQRIKIESMIKSYSQMLSIFIGQDVGTQTLVKPTIDAVVESSINRPELNLFDAQRGQLDAQQSSIKASVTPKIGASIMGFYGNPGLNMFEDMMKNRWSFNWIAGLKVQWNLGGYYTKKSSLQQIELSKKRVDAQQHTFLFNTNLMATQQRNQIEQMRRIMDSDEALIELRISIRNSTQAKFEGGVADVNDLLRDMTAENSAKIEKSAHEIELLKDIYDLKTTINQ